MSNFVNSFIQGANLEQGIRSSHQRERLLDAQDARANVASERAGESHKLSMERGRAGLAALANEEAFRAQLRPIQLEEAKAAQAHKNQLRPHELSAAERQAKAAGVALEQGEFNLEQSKTLWNKTLQDEDMTTRKQQAQYLYPHVIKKLVDSNGDVDAVFREYPEYFELTRDMPNEFNLAYLFDPQQRQKVYGAIDIFNPKTPSSLRDPKSIELLNDVMQDQINAGEGVNPQTGKPIVQKRVTGIYAVPNQLGKVALELEVTDSDNNAYQAPRTNNLSTDDNDTVKMVDANQVMGIMNAKHKMAKTGEQITQLNPNAMAQLSQIYQRLQSGPQQKLDAGYVPYGNGSVKFSDLFESYKSQLPDQQEDPEGHALAIQAMPFHHYRWAGGDDQKMQFVQQAYQHNLHVARTLQQRLAGFDFSNMNEAAEAQKIAQEMQQAFIDPQKEYAAALKASKQQSGKEVEQQSGKDSEKQSGKVAQGRGLKALAEPEYKQPMSLEDYELMEQSKRTRPVTPFISMSGAPSSAALQQQNAYKNTGLESRYQQYVKGVENKNQRLREEHEYQLRAQRQQQINLLTQKLELGRISDDEKLTLKSLLQQQQAGQ